MVHRRSWVLLMRPLVIAILLLTPLTASGAAAPVIDSFSADPTSGWKPLTVDFTCAGHDPDGSIQLYIVNTGEGGNGSYISNTTGTFKYDYKVAGSFQANCSVCDNEWNYSSPSNFIPVNVYGANLSASPVLGGAPLSVDFTCTGYTPNSIQSYSITYGDGGSGIDVTGKFSHIYQDLGSFHATCTMTDQASNQDSASVDISVPTYAPVVDSFGANPTTGWKPLTVDFTCAGHDPDGSIELYLVNTGEGGNGSYISNTTGTFKYDYKVAGSFQANCSVQDNEGIYSSLSNSIPVDVYGANLSASPVSGGAPLSVDFTCTGFTPNSIQSYSMTYGDGGSEIDATGKFSHIYQQPGSFQATCTMTDQASNQNSASVDINVPTYAPVVDSFDAKPTSGWKPLTVDFTCAGHDPDGSIQLYTVNTGEGGNGSYLSNTTGTFKHDYKVPGSYQANCGLYDNEWTYSTSSPIEITVKKPNVPPLSILLMGP